MTRRINEAIGTTGVMKGSIKASIKEREEGRKTIKFVAWDVIDDCKGDECPATKHCKYVKVGQCSAMNAYLRAFYAVILRNYEGVITEPELFQVGMGMSPLYKILCKLKIEEAGVDEVVQQDEKGNLKVHPIYREIRETIKTLNLLWRELGYKGRAPSTGDDLPLGEKSETGVM